MLLGDSIFKHECRELQSQIIDLSELLDKRIPLKQSKRRSIGIIVEEKKELSPKEKSERKEAGRSYHGILSCDTFEFSQSMAYKVAVITSQTIRLSYWQCKLSGHETCQCSAVSLFQKADQYAPFRLSQKNSTFPGVS